MSATARGTLERIQLALAFPPRSTIGILGQRFSLPNSVDATWLVGDKVTLPLLRLHRPKGGDTEISGYLGQEGKFKAWLRLRDYPVAGLPRLDRTAPSGALSGSLGGRLAGEVSLSGTLARPTVEGHLDVASLAFNKRRIGNAKIRFNVGSVRGEAEAQVDPGVMVHAHLIRRPKLEVTTEVLLQDLPLGSWLPPPLAGAPITASGAANVSYQEDSPLDVAGAFSLSGPGFDGVSSTVVCAAKMGARI